MERKIFIEQAFSDINSVDIEELRSLLGKIFRDLNYGRLKVAEIKDEQSIVHEWIKQAILLKFKTSENKVIKSGIGIKEYQFFDKVDLRFQNYTKEDFDKLQIRIVPGAFIREGAFIGKNCVIMPSFVNVGAFIDEKTMIDSGVTVGSCCQIGKNCHISSNVVIAGVLEPIQDSPVIIGDGCFIGAGSVIAEGVIVEKNSVIAMGVHLGKSTKIIDRESGNISYGRIPGGSVVVPGAFDCGKGISINAAIIVKKIDAKTKEKTSINEILRF